MLKSLELIPWKVSSWKQIWDLKGCEWDPYWVRYLVVPENRLDWLKHLRIWSMQINFNELGTTVEIWNPTIQIPDFVKIKWSGFKRWGCSCGFRGGCGLNYILNHLKNGPIEIQTFLSPFSNGFWQNASHLTRFQMVGLPDFRYHSKSGPFATRPLLTIQNPD